MATENNEQKALTSKGLVLADFWAPWCDVCQATSLVAEDLVLEYGGRLTSVKINVDDHPVIAARYQIHAVPTLALLTDGQLVDQFVGFVSRDKLEQAIDRALSERREP